MISLYSGTPGSGKSLHCARTIINWSRLGYPVIGNFTVDLSKYKRAAYTYCPNDEMTPDFLIRYSRERFGDTTPKEGSILLVIDECQLLFNAREWQQSGRAQWLSFFTQHRKLGYDIILIAQFDRMVGRQIRSLIEYEFIHRKMSNFGWQGKLMSLFFGGKTFIAVKMWYPLHERLGAEIFHARKYMYSIYDSYVVLVPPAWKFRDEESQGNAACPGMVVCPSVVYEKIEKRPQRRSHALRSCPAGAYSVCLRWTMCLSLSLLPVWQPSILRR